MTSPLPPETHVPSATSAKARKKKARTPRKPRAPRVQWTTAILPLIATDILDSHIRAVLSKGVGSITQLRVAVEYRIASLLDIDNFAIPSDVFRSILASLPTGEPAAPDSPAPTYLDIFRKRPHYRLPLPPSSPSPSPHPVFANGQPIFSLRDLTQDPDDVGEPFIPQPLPHEDASAGSSAGGTGVPADSVGGVLPEGTVDIASLIPDPMRPPIDPATGAPILRM